MHRHFTEVNIEMTNKHIKRYSTSLTTKGMQIKPQCSIIIHLPE